MYNYKSIQNFMDKVNAEADEAAQKVYDKYKDEFLKRIQNQIKEGDIFNVGMGTASLTNEKGEYVGENLSDIVGAYWDNNLCACFDLPGEFGKNKIIN